MNIFYLPFLSLIQVNVLVLKKYIYTLTCADDKKVDKKYT